MSVDLNDKFCFLDKGSTRLLILLYTKFINVGIFYTLGVMIHFKYESEPRTDIVEIMTEIDQ